MVPNVRALLLAAAFVACDPVATPIVALNTDNGADAGADDAGDGDVPDADLADADAGDAEVEAGAFCGDGIHQDDEYCDDFANPEPGSGCNDTCSGEVG